ncbi:MAG: hypothetical protein WAO74_01615 [Polaribacter sp.]|uniref:hypothetical protein n=1 Tax=Polaribacter sp. TaxID=1920175 RepID=UPI003BAFBED1
MRNRIFLMVIIFGIIASCKNDIKPEVQNQISGLWLVKKITIGNTDLSPSPNWIHFYKDSTQASGTGWMQHSIGSWSYQNESEMLTVKNDNGLNGFMNLEDSFKVLINENSMTLQGKKEEQELIISLEKTNALPTLEANKLFGLWKFDSILINGKEVSDSLNPTKNAMLHLRFENGYTLYNYPLGEKYGIFKAHLGRQQLEMVNYSNSPKFNFYDFNIEGEKLLLKSKDEKTELTLNRIHQYLK